jgi:hypothetical protein
MNHDMRVPIVVASLNTDLIFWLICELGHVEKSKWKIGTDCLLQPLIADLTLLLFILCNNMIYSPSGLNLCVVYMRYLAYEQVGRQCQERLVKEPFLLSVNSKSY